MGNSFLMATFFTALIAIIFNYFALNGTDWRSLDAPATNTQGVLTSTFGFWQTCNTTVKNPKKVCLPTRFDKEHTLNISRSIYYVGYTFQIIGTVLTIVLFLVSKFNNDFAIGWNLYVIFCSAILTFYTLGLYIIIINAIIFVSKTKYLKIDSAFYFYEISFKSSSLLACLGSIFFSIIVIGLTFFSLSFSSINKYKKSMYNMKKDSEQILGNKSGIVSNIYPSTTKLNQNNFVSEENFRFTGRPTFPNLPPPSAPPLSVQAKQSISVVRPPPPPPQLKLKPINEDDNGSKEIPFLALKAAKSLAGFKPDF